MGKSAGKAPKAPSPERIANLDSRYNRMAEFNPLGSSYYSQGEDGTWARIMQYAPEVQNALNWQLYGVNQGMENAITNPLQGGDIQRSLASRTGGSKNDALADMLASARQRMKV